MKIFLDPKSLIRSILTGGLAAYHLWFLPALGIGMMLVLALKRFGIIAVIVSASVLYLIGLAFGPYVEILNLPYLPVPTRYGPMISFLFVAIGYFLARNKFDTNVLMAACICIAGFLLQLVESYFLASTTGDIWRGHDFLFGTIPFGLGAFLLARKIPTGAFVNFLARLGAVSLGMYCIHVLFIRALEHWLNRDDMAERAVLVVAVIALSTLISVVMVKIPYVRRVFA